MCVCVCIRGLLLLLRSYSFVGASRHNARKPIKMQHERGAQRSVYSIMVQREGAKKREQHEKEHDKRDGRRKHNRKIGSGKTGQRENGATGQRGHGAIGVERGGGKRERKV